MVSIETYWNLHVVIDPYALRIGYEDPHVRGDLVLVTHEHFDHNNVGLVAGNPQVVRGLDAEGKVQKVTHMLDRSPNQSHPQWRDYWRWIKRDPHAIEVTSIPAWHDDKEGAERGANAMFLVVVDGVRIVHCGDLGQKLLTEKQLESMGRVDLLLVPVGGKYTLDGRQAAAIVRQVKPRRVVPIHYKTPALTIELDGVEPFLEQIRNNYEIIRPEGNTTAVRSFAGRDPVRPQVIVLDYRPWKMPKDMEDLFAAKETASAATQQVFAPLSVDQMNHRPSDGTHTSRWNAEHMMGRELGFFSEIYAKLDSELAKLDLNPAQMPAEYVAAHPDWTGAEEARQIERVTQFARRFSYLLADHDLDERLPGSRWTISGLLKQMERHYREHTANVKKKIELPDWPAE
jgi:L-ascorbate metabolism protein UlaG (beta-lactamase superfamily)